jgi:hypothetical protein
MNAKRPQTSNPQSRPFSATVGKRPVTVQPQKRQAKRIQSAKKLGKTMGKTGGLLKDAMPSIVRSAHQLRIPNPPTTSVDVSSKHWDIISQQTHLRLAKQLPLK